jgi:DNA-3-methyladenine glycosylase I
MAKRGETTEIGRCPWAKTDLYVQYHDAEWGVPVHDDRLLFEFLILEGAQAGLSWETILKKRENYWRAFDNFDPAIVARYGERKRKSLLADAGIIRNRLKIEAAVQNAKVCLTVQNEFGTFNEYIWGFVDREPKQNVWKSHKEVPAKTPESPSRRVRSRCPKTPRKPARIRKGQSHGRSDRPRQWIVERGWGKCTVPQVVQIEFGI